ncbi:MAG: sulfurtransferase [Asticcacaulis sp.]
MSTQIAPQALFVALNDQTVKVLDASWALDGTDMSALFSQDHIPTAQFFDIEAISDPDSHLPHMAPSPQRFAEVVSRMGISPQDHVVIYDRQGLFSAARVWWTFRLMGHEHVQVLSGGLPAWKAMGYVTTDDLQPPNPVEYISTYNENYIIDYKELLQNLNNPDYLILDARPRARFEGDAPEPRKGLRSGHMPSSHSLPFAELIRDGALKPVDELKSLFRTLGADKADTIVTSCGSGVTAAIISLALTEAGYPMARLYDGSWAEWGQADLTTPVISSDEP